MLYVRLILRHFSMFKNIFALICIGSLLLGCATKKEIKAPTRSEIIGNIKNSTVMLVNKHYGKYSSYCSGVWVSKDTMLTANHCVSMAPRTLQEYINKSIHGIEPNVIGRVIHYKNWKEVTYPEVANTAIVLAVDPKNDVAMLRTVEEDNNHLYAELYSGDIGNGTVLHIMGHTDYGKLSYSYLPGYISGERIRKNPDGHNVKVFQISSAAWSGFSGGGAFNEKGELMGLCSFRKIIGMPITGFFVSSRYIGQLH